MRSRILEEGAGNASNSVSFVRKLQRLDNVRDESFVSACIHTRRSPHFCSDSLSSASPVGSVLSSGSVMLHIIFPTGSFPSEASA